MRKCLFLLLLALVMAAGGHAQNLSIDQTWTATATTKITQVGGVSQFSGYNVCHFSYSLTGSPSGVSVAINVGNALSGTAATTNVLAAVTTTTNATTIPIGTVQGPWRYYYGVVTLTGGTSPTLILTMNCSPTSVGAIPGQNGIVGWADASAGTQGSVPYFNSVGLLTQDNANLYYDAAGNLTVGGSVIGKITTTTPTVGGLATRIEYLASPNANSTSPTPVAIYFHGNNEDQNAAFTQVSEVRVTQRLLAAGFVVASINSGNTWGNATGQTAYLALYTYLKANWNVSRIVFIGQSMGGADSLNLLASGNVPDVDAWYGISPVTNLSNMYNSGAGAYASFIQTAYGFSNPAGYAAATSGYDPYLITTGNYGDFRFRFVASAADTQVSKTSNSDLFSTKVVSVALEDSVITASGNHGDPTQFIPTDALNYFSTNYLVTVDSGGNKTFTPFGSLGVNTTAANSPLSVVGNGGVRGGNSEFSSEVGADNTAANQINVTNKSTSTGGVDGYGMLIGFDGPNVSSSNYHGPSYAFLTNVQAAPLILGTNNLERIRILNGGDVGIGTSTPHARLDIFPTAATGIVEGIRITNNSAGAGDGGSLRFDTAAGSIARIFSYAVGANQGDLGFGLSTGSAGAFTEVARFHNGGLGIGKTPAVPLDVVGAIQGTTTINAGTGFQVNSLAPSNHILVGNGTNYVDSATIPVGDTTLASIDLTAQTAAKTATNLYLPTATGMYRVSYYAKVTTIGSVSSILGGTSGLVVAYTDGTDSVAQTAFTVPEDNQAGNALSVGSGNTTNTTQAVIQGSATVYMKTGVQTTYTFGYTSVNAAEMNYELHIRVEGL